MWSSLSETLLGPMQNVGALPEELWCDHPPRLEVAEGSVQAVQLLRVTLGRRRAGRCHSRWNPSVLGKILLDCSHFLVQFTFLLDGSITIINYLGHLIKDEVQSITQRSGFLFTETHKGDFLDMFILGDASVQVVDISLGGLQFRANKIQVVQQFLKQNFSLIYVLLVILQPRYL